MEQTKQKAVYFRNFVFGVEDSLVSTVGLLSGVATAGVETKTIFLTGLILIFVEAFSMGAGSFLSESSTEDFIEKKEMPARKSIPAAAIMFFSYLVSGFIPLFPYLIFRTPTAVLFSIGLSLVFLFILGLVGAEISKTRRVKSALRMALIGGLAIGAGAFLGKVVG